MTKPNEKRKQKGASVHRESDPNSGIQDGADGEAYHRAVTNGAYRLDGIVFDWREFDPDSIDYGN